MIRILRHLLIGLTIFLHAASAGLAAERNTSLLGLWGGSLEVSSKPTMLWLKVTETREKEYVASVSLNPAPRGFGSLGSIKVQPQQGSAWTLISGVAPNQFRLEVRKDADGFTATYAVSEATGRTHLRRASDNPAANALLTGTYVLPSGDHIYIRTISYGADKVLSYLEEHTGRIGVLYHAGGTSYVGGRSFSLPDPVGLTVEFDKGPVSRMIWKRTGQKPLTATRSLAYRREDVRVAVAEAVLACEALIPTGSGRNAGVVLVPGSGGVDRFADYYVLADLFGQYGIASLVCDKRGTGSSSGDWRFQSFEQQAEDVVAGMAYLRQRPEVDASRVGVWAFSQGTYPGPIAAVAGKASFLIVVAQFAIPLRDNVRIANVERLRRNGLSADEIGRYTDYLTRRQQAVMDNDFEAYRGANQQYAGASWLQAVPTSEQAFKGDWLSARARLMWPYNPEPVLQKLNMPLLAFWGSEDNEAIPSVEQPAFERALREGGNRDYTLRVVPGADHPLFVDVSSIETTGYAAGYFPELVKWLRSRVIRTRN